MHAKTCTMALGMYDLKSDIIYEYEDLSINIPGKYCAPLNGGSQDQNTV